jgi:hypothetical protein
LLFLVVFSLPGIVVEFLRVLRSPRPKAQEPQPVVFGCFWLFPAGELYLKPLPSVTYKYSAGSSLFSVE